jgi:flagellar biosynthesis chaperone FliJ
MVQMNNQLGSYQQQIETLEKEKSELKCLNPSSVQSSTSVDPSEELAKVLSDLNIKEIEVDDMKRMITSKNDEIDIFKDQLKEKDGVIAKYQKLKEKLQKDLEKAQGKLTGKPYLIGARHILWDHIISEIIKSWNYFTLVVDESSLASQTQHNINKILEELSDKP